MLIYLLAPQLMDQELFTLPPLGTHYLEQWRKEDEEEARKGRSRYGYVSTPRGLMLSGRVHGRHC